MDAANTEDCMEDPAERMRQHADAVLTRWPQDPRRLSPGSLVRILFPVIEKHLAAGLTLEDIASALIDDGFAIKRTHLVRHLGIIRAENGLPPLQRGVKATPQGAKKADTKPEAPVTPAPAAEAANEADDQARSQPVQVVPAAPVSAAPFPEIPRGELTHTERSEIAKKWIASQFGDRHPTQVKPDELTPEAQEWLEKLWDRPAPINPKTGQPYAFKRFTPDGRPIYNEPRWPPEAVAVENDEYGDGYVSVFDERTRELIKKYGLRLASKGKPPYLELIVLQDGKQAAGSFLRTDLACLGRVVQDCAWDAKERQKRNAA